MRTVPLSFSLLPTEIQLRVLDFLPTPALLQLTQTSKQWHNIIDAPQQDYSIYYPRTEHPQGAVDLSFVTREASCFTRFLSNEVHPNSWKELCRCQTLLDRRWRDAVPEIRQSIIAPRRLNVAAPFGAAVNGDPTCCPIWRFRPDFQHRFVLSTTMIGGLLVTDMDDGSLLWSLPSDQVRPYAHLEYSNGHCAFDRAGNAIEIWKYVGEEKPPHRRRGEFERVAVLSHDVETRGFQLRWPHLCVVSVEERGFVYKFARDGTPRMTQEMDIAPHTVGHLDQTCDTVVYCMGQHGYHFHSKETGKLCGVIDPRTFGPRGLFHIRHDHSRNSNSRTKAKQEPLPPPFPPRRPRSYHQPIKLDIKPGRLYTKLRDGSGLQPALPLMFQDEWGAALIRDNLMVAISKAGRCMLCLDWPRAIRSHADAAQCTVMFELEINSSTYDYGGWLSLQRGPPGSTRVIFEVDEKIYLVRVKGGPDDILNVDDPGTFDVLAIPSTFAPHQDIPISFMGIYDDCIMHTVLLNVKGQDGAVREPYLTKAIRVVSFAPLEQYVITARDDELRSRPKAPDDEWVDI